MDENTNNPRMSIAKQKSYIALFIIITLCTCIDPYSPKLKGYDSLLVVEGLITNEKAQYEVKLSKTMQAQNLIPEKVSDAVVSISDDLGINTILRNLGNGLYKTDSTVFIGVVGKTYTLHILTHDGKEYESEPTIMLPVPEIDSLYYSKNVEYTNNQSETHEGISIYLDSKKVNGFTNYIRWEYEETWKFRLPTIKKFNYINEKLILPVTYVKEFCWKQKKSTEILFQSFSQQEAGNIKNVPITFIGSELSDRLTIQYSILVKQYSVSEKEFKFWNDLKKVNETTGDIFGSQPFYVTSNISNIQDKNEKALGYFQVSAVSKKRKDISFMELLKLNLPLFHYNCKTFATAPGDYCLPGAINCVPPTWDELYQMWTGAQFIFIEPDYIPDTKNLRHLIFATSLCSDCELTGTLVKPPFWIDLN
jgi:hypothetical protein